MEQDEGELEENEVVLEDSESFAFYCKLPQNLFLIRVTHVRTWYSNMSHGYYSRAATISFSTSGGAATIRERLLIESGV